MVFLLNHIESLDLSQKVAFLISEDNRVFVVAEFPNRINLAQVFVMGSFLFEPFLHLKLGLTLKSNSLCDEGRGFSLCLSDSGYFVSVGISHDFRGIGRGLLHNLSLNKSRLSDDLVVLKISFSINLIDHSVSVGIPLTLSPGNFSFDFLNFFGLLHLF